MQDRGERNFRRERGKPRRGTEEKVSTVWHTRTLSSLLYLLLHTVVFVSNGTGGPGQNFSLRARLL